MLMFTTSDRALVQLSIQRGLDWSAERAQVQELLQLLRERGDAIEARTVEAVAAAHAAHLRVARAETLAEGLREANARLDAENSQLEAAWKANSAQAVRKAAVEAIAAESSLKVVRHEAVLTTQIIRQVTQEAAVAVDEALLEGKAVLEAERRRKQAHRAVAREAARIGAILLAEEAAARLEAETTADVTLMAAEEAATIGAVRSVATATAASLAAAYRGVYEAAGAEAARVAAGRAASVEEDAARKTVYKEAAAEAALQATERAAVAHIIRELRRRRRLVAPGKAASARPVAQAAEAVAATSHHRAESHLIDIGPSGVEWARNLLANEDERRLLCAMEFGADDLNGNGTLDPEEAWLCVTRVCDRVGLELPRLERCEELFVRCDKNKDGAIQLDEFQPFFRTLLASAVNKAERDETKAAELARLEGEIAAEQEAAFQAAEAEAAEQAKAAWEASRRMAQLEAKAVAARKAAEKAALAEAALKALHEEESDEIDSDTEAMEAALSERLTEQDLSHLQPADPPPMQKKLTIVPAGAAAPPLLRQRSNPVSTLNDALSTRLTESLNKVLAYLPATPLQHMARELRCYRGPSSAKAGALASRPSLSPRLEEYLDKHLILAALQEIAAELQTTVERDRLSMDSRAVQSLLDRVPAMLDDAARRAEFYRRFRMHSASEALPLRPLPLLPLPM